MKRENILDERKAVGGTEREVLPPADYFAQGGREMMEL